MTIALGESARFWSFAVPVLVVLQAKGALSRSLPGHSGAAGAKLSAVSAAALEPLCLLTHHLGCKVATASVGAKLRCVVISYVASSSLLYANSYIITNITLTVSICINSSVFQNCCSKLFSVV